jgi:Stage II sporulation protein M
MEQNMSVAEGEVPSGEKSALGYFLSRGRLILVAIAVGIELAIFFAGAVVPVDQATQQVLNQTANGLRNATTNAPALVTMRVIFSNNLRVALIEMIPGIGPVAFVASIFTTGQLLQVITMATGIPGILTALILFVFPYTIVELSAYGLAVVSGSMLIVAWRKKTLHREIRVFFYEAVGVVVILFVAAAMETATLQSLSVGIGLWLPLGLFVAWLAIKLRRIEG